ncbi:uncharacterized protein LOC125778061 [Bactrocera dorsalis]|uniref:Uncharacterized protein LOC125778061 n=1 Tax=Bactrocera dorsalis TaxID=27457 RepID=A0ABM3JLS5_BACDO|nr:uncharacterized protein LOC125778061 [Bactrocera dorsalis]
MGSLNNQTMILSLLGLSTLNEEFMKKLVEIVVATSKERLVNTIIYTSFDNSTSTRAADGQALSNILRSLAEGQDKPLLHFDTSPPIEIYVTKFNNALLTIAKLNQRLDQDKHLLVTLWRRLYFNTQTRLILLFEDSASEAYVKQIMQMCAKNRATRVIALQPRMTVIERSYWALHIFPTPQIVKRTLPSNGTQLFHDHVKNMYGSPLRILESAILPQIYRYTSREGGPSKLSGYVGKTLVEYVNRHNGTLSYPLSTDQGYILLKDMVRLFKNNTLDIGQLMPYSLKFRHLSFTVVFKCTDYCFMVPLEQPLPKYTFYFKIIRKSFVAFFCANVALISCFAAIATRFYSKLTTSITDYVCNMTVVSGLLGMPFWTAGHTSKLHKVIYVSASLVGIIFGTAYATFLQSYSINPPFVSKAESIEELIDRGFKVAVSKFNLFSILYTRDLEKYGENFIIFDNITKFLMSRDNLDTRYAFGVTDMWSVYNEQQKYFSHPLFRLSDICLGRGYPMVLPLQKNSIYRDSLNKFVRRLREAGLLAHWRRRSFLEMLAMKWITLENRNQQPAVEPMKLKDLRIVLMAYAALLSLSIICFVLEIYWVKIQNICVSLKEKLCKIKIRK